MKLNITIDIPDKEIIRLFGDRTSPTTVPVEAPIEPVDQPATLIAGVSYFNREGEGPIVPEFCDQDGDFRCDDGYWYRSDGQFCGGDPHGDSRDLIIPG